MSEVVQQNGAPATATANGESYIVDVGSLSVEETIARLVNHAVALPASDLFFSPNANSVSVLVRHLGLVRPIATLPAEKGRRCIAQMKVAAGMDISEKRRPLDGRWIFHPEGGEAVDMRINSVPTIHGEDIALRLLSRKNQLFDINRLGMTPGQIGELVNMIEGPSGLILVSGPTGSGKTATLYSCLLRLNDGRRKINTIEDPVEHMIEGLRQSQVHPAIDLGFAELLRSVLRQSPDIIMIGEIRDAETAQTAVRAANSGQLVLATIHAPTAAGAVQSMRSLGVHPHFLATALRGVLAQRLVRTLCPHCRLPIDVSSAPHIFDDVRKWLSDDEGRTLFASRGCGTCNMVGYSGRSGVFEVLPVTKEIRNLISEGHPTSLIRDTAIRSGMLEFKQSALLKVARGETSTEEVFRVIPTEHLMVDD